MFNKLTPIFFCTLSLFSLCFFIFKLVNEININFKLAYGCIIVINFLLLDQSYKLLKKRIGDD